MGRLETIYHQIQSVAITDEFVSQMLQLYIDTVPLTYHDFYASILNYYQVIPDKMNEKEKHALYFEVWKEWKESILSLSEDIMKYPYDTDYSSYELIDLKKELLEVPDTKTWASTLEMMKEYPNLFEFFFEQLIGTKHSKWCQIERHKLKVENTQKAKINHRLYLNCRNCDIHFLIRRLREKFEEKNLDYRLKFDTSEDARDDKIILYSDTMHLMDYITVLKEVERDYPDFMKYALNTPLLTGNIDSWIGYGEEPVYSTESYNDLRAHILYQCITEQTCDLFIEDEKKLYQMAEYFIEVKKIVPIDNEKTETYQMLMEKLKEEITLYLKNNTYETKGLIEIKKTLPNFIKKYILQEEQQIKKLTNKIKTAMQSCYIDPNKICFHLDTLDKFRLYDKKGSIDELSFLNTLKLKIQPSYFQTGDGVYQSIKNILYTKFTKLIMMDGTIYTKENQKVKANYFLEDFVHDEFTKEKVVYAQIYQDHIRGNIGKIKLDDKTTVTPWEFTEYLSDLLLEETIVFEEQKTCTVRDCMNQLEPYLPESGMIYTVYGKRMKLLDFLNRSFLEKEQFLYYPNIIFWFYEHMSNNPGVFFIQDTMESEEGDNFKEVEVQKLLI